jgi:hypothetical protein
MNLLQAIVEADSLSAFSVYAPRAGITLAAD